MKHMKKRKGLCEQQPKQLRFQGGGSAREMLRDKKIYEINGEFSQVCVIDVKVTT